MFTTAATLQYVQQHLDEDMEMMARQQPRPIEPSLPADSGALLSGAGTSTSVPAGAVLLLQVVHVEDVSLPLRERLQAVLPADVPSTSLAWGKSGTGRSGEAEDDVASDDDELALNEEEPGQNAAAAAANGGGSVALATLQASEAAEEARHRKRYGGSGPWRCLRFVLTDGFTRILAIEDRRAASTAAQNVAGRGPPVFPSGVTLGSKIKIALEGQGLPAMTSSILRLHSGNTAFIGGEVRALQVLVEADARARLAAMTGRPSALQRRTGTAAVSAGGIESSHADSYPPQPPRIADTADPIEPASASPTAPAGRVVPPTQPTAQPSQPNAPSYPATSQVPRSSPPLPLMSLESWDAHVRDWAGHPFHTQAVITEVVSDMLLNEYPAEVASQLLPTTLGVVQASGDWSPASGDAITLYSLLVQLSTPAAAAASQSSVSVSSSSTLIVDLGHPWLLELVGMPPRTFRALSEVAGRDAQQAARLQSLIERVGHVLENLGVVTLVLQQRPLDQVVEVVAVEPAAH